MNVTLRIVLDWEEDDVIRDISVPSEFNLEQLHLSIVRAFNLSEGEMALFYETNENWEQGAEIPLMSFDDAGPQMRDQKVGAQFGSVGKRLIYVYDLLDLWTFFIECVAIDEEASNQSRLVLKKGERPAEAPLKEMESDSFDDELNDWNHLEGDDEAWDDLED
jgi:hypothetical protein